jgi:hemoglobin
MPSLPIVERRECADPPDTVLDGAASDPRAPDASPPRPELRDEDLHELLAAFYRAVAEDPELAPYFTHVDMAAHLPRIVAFWSTLLFHTGRYSGNAFRPHLEMPGLTADHFARWVRTLEDTVDARFAGAAAAGMKALGHRIAYSMQLRLGIMPFADHRALG